MNQQEQQQLQRKIIELNMLDQRCKQIQQQVNVVDQQLTELQLLENNINEVKKIENNSETLSQLGQGIFVKSKVNKIDEVFIDIGSKIVVKKNVEDAKELIKKRIEQVMNIRELILQELSNMILTIQILEKEIQQKIEKKSDKDTTQ